MNTDMILSTTVIVLMGSIAIGCVYCIFCKRTPEHNYYSEEV